MTLSATTVAVLSGCVLVILLVAGWAYRTANRLDRLNVRVDLSRQSLVAALDRRAVVARAIATALRHGGRGELGDQLAADLAAGADRAEHAAAVDREAAENEVSALLGKVPATLAPALLTELADAETRVMMARRFYNDAVRDTRSLARRRPVRWLRLGGTAAAPEYFEIVDRVPAGYDQ